MFHIDIVFDFARQVREYASFVLEDQDFGQEPLTYVEIAFWIKTKTGFVPCIKIGSDIIEADLVDTFGTYNGVVDSDYVEKARKARNVTVIDLEYS